MNALNSKIATLSTEMLKEIRSEKITKENNFVIMAATTELFKRLGAKEFSKLVGA